jgi:hypothetical protein
MNPTDLQAEDLRIELPTPDHPEWEASLQRAKTLYEEFGAFVAGGVTAGKLLDDICGDVGSLIQLKMCQEGMGDLRAREGASRFDDGFVELNERDREFGGTIYRACRRITPIHQLATSRVFIEIAKGLMETDLLISNGIMAVRIDQPNEDKFLFDWHQDYPFIQDSLDGVVFWMSLHDVDETNGWLRIIPGSHKRGLLPLRITDMDNTQGNRAHSMKIDDLSVVDEMPHLNVPLKKGDALVFNTLLLHCSQPNRSDRARWTIQVRYGNFRHPTAIEKNWPGTQKMGLHFEASHPEYVVDSPHKT